jgi:hypothetical protein
VRLRSTNVEKALHNLRKAYTRDTDIGYKDAKIKEAIDLLEDFSHGDEEEVGSE